MVERSKSFERRLESIENSGKRVGKDFFYSHTHDNRSAVWIDLFHQIVTNKKPYKS